LTRTIGRVFERVRAIPLATLIRHLPAPLRALLKLKQKRNPKRAHVALHWPLTVGSSLPRHERFNVIRCIDQRSGTNGYRRAAQDDCPRVLDQDIPWVS